MKILIKLFTNKCDLYLINSYIFNSRLFLTKLLIH